MTDPPDVMGHLRAKLRVVVADDHELFRRGLRELLEADGISVVGETPTGRQAIELCARVGPSVLVTDLQKSPAASAGSLGEATVSIPNVPVVVLTATDDSAAIIEAVLAGASGYLLKNAPGDEIVAGIRAAAEGDAALSPRAAAVLMQSLREAATIVEPVEANLSERELEVLTLMAQGHDNAAIAQLLSISPHTVKTHVSTILQKLNAKNRMGAAMRAVRGGVLRA